MFGPLWSQYTAAAQQAAAPPNPMTASLGSSGLGWKAERIVSTRDMPRVTKQDYAAIPGSWTAVLEVYRIHRWCGVKSRDARREILVMLEPWAWAIEKATQADRKTKRGGAGSVASGGRLSPSRRN